jgi:hypothetical protein
MPNYENFFAYDYWQYEVVRHLFSFTAAVFAASFVWFVLNASRAAQRYRAVGVISGVVMISATLELFLLWFMWNQAFEFDPETSQMVPVATQVFANGYRYANWLIDVPMLMLQFVIVLGLTGVAVWRTWWKLAVAGVSMVILGYVGQYWEPQAAGFVDGSAWGFWVFGLLGWLPVFYIFWVLGNLVKQARGTMGREPLGMVNAAWALFIVTWILYGLVYLVPGIPGINQDATWVVVRQAGYTFADVTSKAVFGVLLGFATLALSRAEAELRSDPSAVAPVQRAGRNVSG